MPFCPYLWQSVLTDMAPEKGDTTCRVLAWVFDSNKKEEPGFKLSLKILVITY